MRFLFLSFFFVLVSCSSMREHTVHGQVMKPEAPEAQFAPPEEDFQAWIKHFKNDVLQLGISEKTLQRAFRGVQYAPRVYAATKKQPEFTLTFWDYMDIALDPERVKEGKRLLQKHRKLLQRIEKKYGVPAHVLVAFWGLETRYGDTFGGYKVIDALTTLLYHDYRKDFYTKQLVAALQIIQSGDIAPENMYGSWSGAMGHMQFIPTTFQRYALDEDGDGKRDIWGSLPDALASAAHYLSSLGWQEQQRWGREILLPSSYDHFDFSSLTETKPLSFWRQEGFTIPYMRAPLPSLPLEASWVMPEGADGPSFLLYPNFRVIMQWNKSLLYALGIGLLSDQLVNQSALFSKRLSHHQALTPEQVRTLQYYLKKKKYYKGKIDGLVGSGMRAAVRQYQKSFGYKPADGHPSVRFYETIF